MMVACQVRAANYTWIGPATGETWSSASNNWNAASTPIWDSVNGPTNSAVFSAEGLVAKVNEAVYASNVTFSAGATLTNNVNREAINLTTGGALTLANGKTATIFAPIIGSNTVINNDSGGSRNLYLAGSNSFSGLLSLKSTANDGAFVKVDTQTNLGTADITVGGRLTDAAGLNLALAGQTFTNRIALYGMGGNTGRGRLYVNGNNITWAGPITLLANSQITFPLNGTVSSLAGVISGGYNLTLRGGGNNYSMTVRLGGSNTFTGGLTFRCANLLNMGEITLVLDNEGALNNTVGQENYLTFPNASGTLNLNGRSVTLSGVTSTNVFNNGSVVPIIQNASSTNVTLTVGNASNSNSFFIGIVRDGTGGGTLGLAKAGTGTLTLANTNQYTGATTVLAGTLVMTNAVASTNWVVATNATLSVNGAVALGGKTLTLATGGDTAGLLRVNGNLTLGGTLTVSAPNEVTTQMTLAECTGEGTISGGAGSFLSTSLPIGTLLKVSDDGKTLLLIKKPKGTMIRVF
jgi:autotransporter-associated beta strand protein